MTNKTITGAVFSNFYKNHWPEGWYHEDCEYEVEDEYGNLIVAPTAVLELQKLGYLVNEKDSKQTMSFVEAWERFAADPAAPVVISLAVPRTKLAELKAAIEALSIEGLTVVASPAEREITFKSDDPAP